MLLSILTESSLIKPLTEPKTSNIFKSDERVRLNNNTQLNKKKKTSARVLILRGNERIRGCGSVYIQVDFLQGHRQEISLVE